MLLVYALVRLVRISALAPANPESGHFFGNPAKCASGQISSRIWSMPLQLQCVELITDKTNAADLSSGVFAILISVTRSKNALPFHKFVKNWQTVT